MSDIPDWVKPGAAVAIIVHGRLSDRAYLHTIVRVGKKYAILGDGSRFDATRQFNGMLSRPGESIYEPNQYLQPADSPRVVAALTKQRIGSLGVKLTRVIEALINEPTVDRADHVRDLIQQILEATQNVSQ